MGWAGRRAARHNPSERLAAVFSSTGAAVLELADDLTGTFDVYLETFGEAFQGPPQATVVRDGARLAVATRDGVPGDVLLVEEKRKPRARPPRRAAAKKPKRTKPPSVLRKLDF